MIQNAPPPYIEALSNTFPKTLGVYLVNWRRHTWLSEGWQNFHSKSQFGHFVWQCCNSETGRIIWRTVFFMVQKAIHNINLAECETTMIYYWTHVKILVTNLPTTTLYYDQQVLNKSQYLNYKKKWSPYLWNSYLTFHPSLSRNIKQCSRNLNVFHPFPLPPDSIIGCYCKGWPTLTNISFKSDH